jgi:hypothetical protein
MDDPGVLMFSAFVVGYIFIKVILLPVFGFIAKFLE